MNTIDTYLWSSYQGEIRTRFYFSDFLSKIGFGCILGNFEDFLTQNGARTKFDCPGGTV